jgi:hypothetical protein
MFRRPRRPARTITVADTGPLPAAPSAPERGFGWFFRLTHQAAQRRLLIVIAGFFGMWLLIGVVTHRNELFQDLLDLLQGLPLTYERGVILQLFVGSIVLKRLVLAFAAYSIALNLAGIYLGDVFERGTSVGRKFVFQAAFATSYDRINIREGVVANEDQEAPMVQIGGPGAVIVELDSAILVEGPYGYRVIPAGENQENRYGIILDGFERIRQGVLLTDREDTQKIIWARTREGVPVNVEDIHYRYSIYRAGQTASEVIPYPFDEQAVVSQVYKQSRPAKSLSEMADWKTALPRPIFTPVARQIGEFISSHSISEVLANIGDPELDALSRREENIEVTSRLIAGTNGQGSTKIMALEPGRYVPRSDLTNRFNDERFKQIAQGIGFQINWIGVGTWVLPSSSILANHVDAWRLSRENFDRGDEENLRRLQDDARLQESMRLLQERIGKFTQAQAEHEENPRAVIGELLADYHELLLSGLDLFQRDGEDPPLELLDAIRVISERRGKSVNWVGL